MKEYEQRATKIIMNTVEGVKAQIRKAYNKGYEDGQKEKLANAMIHDHEVAEKTAYEQGLNDVWEVIKKITADESKGGYPIKMLNELFGSIHVYNIVHDYTPQEAIAKIKEYEDKQKCKECKKTKDPIFYGHCVGECDYAKQTEDEIKVGDEITSYTDTNNLVIGIGVWGEWDCITAYGTGFKITKGKQKYWKKTGRHFDVIPEVLKQMKG